MFYTTSNFAFREVPTPFSGNCENTLLNVEFYMFGLLVLEYINYYLFLIAVILYFM
jgi:hypothetical protein